MTGDRAGLPLGQLLAGVAVGEQSRLMGGPVRPDLTALRPDDLRALAAGQVAEVAVAHRDLPRFG